MAIVEDRDRYARRFGYPVSFTGSRAALLGVESFEDQDVRAAVTARSRIVETGRAAVIGRSRIVEIPTADAASLAPGDVFTFNGTDYTVATTRAVADGIFTLVYLRG